MSSDACNYNNNDNNDSKATTAKQRQQSNNSNNNINNTNNYHNHNDSSSSVGWRYWEKLTGEFNHGLSINHVIDCVEIVKRHI